MGRCECLFVVLHDFRHLLPHSLLHVFRISLPEIGVQPQLVTYELLFVANFVFACASAIPYKQAQSYACASAIPCMHLPSVLSMGSSIWSLGNSMRILPSVSQWGFYRLSASYAHSTVMAHAMRILPSVSQHCDTQPQVFCHQHCEKLSSKTYITSTQPAPAPAPALAAGASTPCTHPATAAAATCLIQQQQQQLNARALGGCSLPHCSQCSALGRSAARPMPRRSE